MPYQIKLFHAMAEIKMERNAILTFDDCFEFHWQHPPCHLPQSIKRKLIANATNVKHLANLLS
jgi:hypothetical protein